MNMLEEYINFEKNNILLFAKEVLSTLFDEEIFLKLLNSYIDNRYYNYYGNNETNIEENVFIHLKKVFDKLNEDLDEESKEKLTEMYMIFNYVLCFDEVNNLKDKTLIKLLCDYRKDLFGITDGIFQENITKFIINTKKKRSKFFDYFNTNEFYLEKYSTTKDYLIDVELKYSINFPRIYSEYAIDRVFNESDINEDKLFVEYYLLTRMIIKDIKACIFNRFYLIEFAVSLFEDKERLDKLLLVASNDLFKSQTIFKINYNDYVNYGSRIKDLIRDGYKFAIDIGEENIDDDYILMSIFEYVIISNKSKYCNEIGENDKIIMINDR